MTRFLSRVRFRWVLMTFVSLALASVLLCCVISLVPDQRSAPANHRVEDVVRGISTPYTATSRSDVAYQPVTVPPDAILAERRVINGYEVSVWEPAAGTWWEYGHSIAQITSPGGEMHSIDFVLRIDPVAGTDITGDGIPEVIIERDSGGASCCVSYVVESLGDPAWAIPLPLSSPGRATFVDLDGDGSFEVIGTDGSFRCVLCCCADSPEPLVVLKYVEGQGYTPASPEFPEVVDALIPEYRARAEGCRHGLFEEQDPAGRCCILPLVLALLYSGRTAAAWEAAEQYLQSASEAAALRAEVEEIVAASRLYVAQDWSKLLASRTKTFSLSADLDGDGADEMIVGLGAVGADKVAEFTRPGDVYVCSSASTAESPDVRFSCRTALPADLLPGFFEAQPVCVGDLDDDGLNEVVLVWLEQYWWPTAYRPLAVLQFDSATETYEMVIDVNRSVCEIGDYAAEDVDGDGHIELLEVRPIYGSDINPEDGVEEFECHFCPHRYEVCVFEFTGSAFVADVKVNGGRPFVTAEKHVPYLGDGPVSSFLPELIAAARRLASLPCGGDSGEGTVWRWRASAHLQTDGAMPGPTWAKGRAGAVGDTLTASPWQRYSGAVIPMREDRDGRGNPERRALGSVGATRTRGSDPKRLSMTKRAGLSVALVVALSCLVVSAPNDVVQFGQYDLRVTSLLNCASARGRPYTSVLISRDSIGWTMLPDVLLDSGADLSFFPAWVAEALGIDLSQCEQGLSQGVGGVTAVYYTEVYLSLVLMGGIEPDVDGYILGTDGEPLVIKALVAFSEAEANANTFLLGRRDVFSAISLTFRGDRATVTPASSTEPTPTPPSPTPAAPTPTAPSGMVLIPAGSFQMGDAFNEGDTDERPVHTVSVSAFYMDKHEVTKALWDEVAAWAQSNGYDIGTGSAFGTGPAHPATYVSWYEAVKWANARSEKERLIPCYTVSGSVYRSGESSYVSCNWSASGYRLPTEAEWEKAARGGGAGRRYPWGDDIGANRANYNSNLVGTTPVGSYAANGYGLYDMVGNVWEWCWDWYSATTYASSPGTDPRGPASGSDRVYRGGGWCSHADYCRVAHRFHFWPDFDYDALGFRLVRTAP